MHVNRVEAELHRALQIAIRRSANTSNTRVNMSTAQPAGTPAAAPAAARAPAQAPATPAVRNAPIIANAPVIGKFTYSVEVLKALLEMNVWVHLKLPYGTSQMNTMDAQGT